MLRKRVVVCLDVRDGRVVKGTSFVDLRDVGDPVALAARYQAEGADEVVFLDITASAEGRGTLLEVVRRAAEELFVPLVVGGGIRSVDDVAEVLRAGADKVAVNSAAVARPELLAEAAARFGRQCVVLSIDARREPGPEHGTVPAGRPGAASDDERAAGRERPRFRVVTHGGRQATDLDAVEWARRGAGLGAGEVLVTSIDRDGRRDGYDLELTGAIAGAVTVPVIASGGGGCAGHLRDVFVVAGADAALVAGIVHDGTTTVGALKRELHAAGIAVRLGEGWVDRDQAPSAQLKEVPA
jgi:cyclase